MLYDSSCDVRATYALNFTKKYCNVTIFIVHSTLNCIAFLALYYTAIPYRASTGPARTGFSLCTFPTQGKTCFHYRVPRWWKQVFPWWKYYTGKTLFSLKGWVHAVYPILKGLYGWYSIKYSTALSGHIFRRNMSCIFSCINARYPIEVIFHLWLFGFSMLGILGKIFSCTYAAAMYYLFVQICVWNFDSNIWL